MGEGKGSSLLSHWALESGWLEELSMQWSQQLHKIDVHFKGSKTRINYTKLRNGGNRKKKLNKPSAQFSNEVTAIKLS